MAAKKRYEARGSGLVGLSQGALEEYTKYASMLATGQAQFGTRDGLSGGAGTINLSLFDSEGGLAKYIEKSKGKKYSRSLSTSTKSMSEAQRRLKRADVNEVDSLIKAIQSRESEIRARKAAPALAQTRGSLI